MKTKNTIEQCIYNKLKEQADRNNIIQRNKLIIVLGYFYHIPKELRKDVLKELERKKMIIRKNKDLYKLNKREILK